MVWTVSTDKESKGAEAMKKCLLTIFTATLMMLSSSGCATALYIGEQCSGNPDYVRRSNLKIFGNIMNGDCEVMKETWNGPDDYVLPPWLHRSLNTASVCFDFPISFVFDVVTFPYQWWRYYHLPPITEKNVLP